MNRIEAIIFAVALVAAGPALSADPHDAAINASYDGLARARSTDFTSVADSFHPQGIFVFLAGPQGPGPAVTGAEMPARTEAMANRMARDGMRMETGYRIERRSVIGDVAVDTGYMRSVQIRGDQRQTHYARFLLTLKRDGASWRIIADSSWISNEEAYRAVRPVEGLKYDD